MNFLLSMSFTKYPPFLFVSVFLWHKALEFFYQVSFYLSFQSQVQSIFTKVFLCSLTFFHMPLRPFWYGFIQNNKNCPQNFKSSSTNKIVAMQSSVIFPITCVLKFCLFSLTSTPYSNVCYSSDAIPVRVLCNRCKINHSFQSRLLCIRQC